MMTKPRASAVAATVAIAAMVGGYAAFLLAQTQPGSAGPMAGLDRN